MFKFVLTYPDQMTKEQSHTVLGRLRGYSYEWLKEKHVIIANIRTRYNEIELPDEIKHEYILEFDLEPECYGGPDPIYHQKCREQIAKFGQEIIVDRRYSDLLEIGGQLPNSYYLEEV